MAARDDAGGGTGSARRRRQRRLRSHLRHERMAVAMALVESTHHRAQRQKTARAGGKARDALRGHVPGAPLSQSRVLRHVVGHLSVPALDVPVPQMAEQLPDIEQFFRALSPDPEQVIEVPMFLPLDVPMRAALRVTQLVEKLVEVLTILSYSLLLQRTVEQTVDIPVPQGGGGSISGLQGFSSGKRSTASPSSMKRISKRIVEQIVDPVSSGRLQGSSSSHSPAGVEERADEPGEGVFRTFPRPKKSAKLASHSGSELLPSRAHPRRLLSWRTPSSGCSSGNVLLARPTSGTDVLERLPGSHRLASRSCGSAKGMRREGSGTGTGIRVFVRMTSLLFLLAEELYRQLRAVHKYWAGGYVLVALQRQVPAVLRVRLLPVSVHRQSFGHSCYASETGIRSATVQVVGSVHSCFLADEVAAALVVDIGSCMFRAGFAGDQAILAVLPLIGDRPKIFGILVGMDRPGSGHRQLHVHSWFCW